MTTNDIRQAIGVAEENVGRTRDVGDDLERTWYEAEIRLLENALARRTGEKPPAALDADPIALTLETAGIDALKNDASMAVIEEALRNLALLLNDADEIRRAAVREAALKKLHDIGISAPGKLLDAAIPKTAAANGNGKGTGRSLFLSDPEPWESPVDGALLLEDMTTLVRQYVVVSVESAHAVALWILHCWALNAFDISPILGIISPTKRCGKTTILEVVSMSTPRAVSSSNITAAALFRIVEKYSPTLLVDEADTFLGDNDELRGVINSGHRRSSAFVVRTVGEDHEPRQFSTWGPKAIALIGKLPATVEDRAIIIAMRRRAPREIVARFRASECEAAAEPLRRRAFKWANDAEFQLRARDPIMPEQLNDRAADNWRPLVAIADIAGGAWPARARAAAVTLSKEADEADSSALIDLLGEMRDIFTARDRITSAELAEQLGSNTDGRFAEWRHGKPITQRQVARLLAPLKIKPETIRIGSKTAKGYLKEWFDDAFSRYTPLSIRNTVTCQENQDVRPEIDPSQNAAVTDRKTDVNGRKHCDVTVVTDEKQKSGAVALDPWEKVA